MKTEHYHLIKRADLPKIFTKWYRENASKPEQFLSRTSVKKLSPVALGKAAARKFIELSRGLR